MKQEPLWHHRVSLFYSRTYSFVLLLWK